MSLAAFITAQRVEHGVPYALSCRAVGVSQAWYYKWRHGDVSLRRARRTAIDAAVAYQFARRQGRDGSPPITIRLRDAGWRISKNTIADSMRRQGLVARPKKRRHGLTKADRRARKPPDLLKRDFAPPPAMNQRWVSDLTEIDTDEGVLYLASILDLNSRRAVGYALGEHHDADLAAAAVQVAIAVRGGDVAGVVFHTDQGGEFSGGELTRVCAAAGITQSMGRTGSALDNAVAEAFHSTLEFELRSRHRFATRAQARRAVLVWLEEYNTVRLHSTNGMLSPLDYEHGRRRPGAKSYDQLRRRRRRHGENNPDQTGRRPPDKTEAEAAEPPQELIEPLRDGHQHRAGTGPPLQPQGPRSPAALTPEPLQALAGNIKGRPQPALAHARCTPRNKTDQRNQTKILKHKVLQDHIHPSLYGLRGLPGTRGHISALSDLGGTMRIMAAPITAQAGVTQVVKVRLNPTAAQVECARGGDVEPEGDGPQKEELPVREIGRRRRVRPIPAGGTGGGSCTPPVPTCCRAGSRRPPVQGGIAVSS